jgi:uncharacterized protein YdbL (DUF1318 family)
MPRWIPILLVVALTTSIPGISALATDEESLKKRFESRYDTLVKLKDLGKIGETSAGYAEAVEDRYLPEKIADAKGSETIVTFLGAENSDRDRLYVLIADKTSATPKEVAMRNARRVFSKAPPHHYLKMPSGKWVQKKDLRRVGAAY